MRELLKAIIYSIMFLLFVFGVHVLVGCGEVKSKPIKNDLSTVQFAYDANLSKAQGMVDEHGWLNSDCDAMLYDGLAYAGGLRTFNPYLAMVEDGRFNRRPSLVPCRVSWSRDMALGLLTYAYTAKDLDLLKKHAEYGQKNFWVMGKPVDDGRVIYTPQIYGLVYQLIFYLGGYDHVARLWPTFYPEDLMGFEVHLQMISIWLRSQVAEKPDPAPTLTESVPKTLYGNIVHYSNADESNTLAWVLRCKYGRDCQRAIDNCTSGIVSGHIQGDERATLSELLFACKILLDAR